MGGLAVTYQCGVCDQFFDGEPTGMGAKGDGTKVPMCFVCVQHWQALHQMGAL
jgi:hypothetical protein